MVYRGRLEDSAGNDKGQGVVRSLSLLEAEESTIPKKDIIELLVRRACA
jgi:hypothetical protein